MNITQEANGISLVVETRSKVFFGRLVRSEADQVLLRKATMTEIERGSKRESFIRYTAKFGFAGELNDVTLSPHDVLRSRRLGEVPKEESDS